MKSEQQIKQRLSTIADGETERQESTKNRLTYCPVCDEYCIEYIDRETDEWHQLDCTDEHFDQILVSDYEETSLLGFQQALQWVLDGSPKRASGETE